MAGVEERIHEAAAPHRHAVAVAAAAGAVLETAVPRTSTTDRSIRELAERLRVAGALAAPGWLGARLDAVAPSTPLGEATRPEVVRIGTAYPLDDASFPVVVPFGHVAFDGDARDPRVAGVLRSVLLRLLATVRPGLMLVRAVDAAGVAFGDAGEPNRTEPNRNLRDQFSALYDAGIMSPPVTDRGGLCGLLTEAEQWVSAHPDGAGPATRLLVVASWPEATEPMELTRLSALAAAGPGAGLHLLLAGWPPLLLGEDATEPMAMTAGRSGPPLPDATQVTLRNPYALVGNPPGGSFGARVPDGATPSSGLAAQVFLDEPPPADLVTRVCHDLAAHMIERARTTLGDVLGEGPLWQQDAAAGLEVVLGRAGDAPAGLRLTGANPHCLVSGEPGSGRTALLLDILYGLCSRYGPQQLRCYLLDFTGNGSFADFVPKATDASYLPHARAVGLEPDREEGVAVLRGLAAEPGSRSQPPGEPGPRILCVIDGVDELLLDDAGPLAQEAGSLLESLAAGGGGSGIHLILAGGSAPPERVARHCRIRIALRGGDGVLDPANQAAAALTSGEAVINTAGGLGGPPRVTRAHEQRVRFPDPYPEATVLAGLRHRLWRAGGGGS